MTGQKQLRVLVADDEPLARERLIDLLEKEESVELIGIASNGDEAIRNILGSSPDLVFLDIQMPGANGIEVIRRIGAEAMPATVFVTAFDQFALQAFELAAVDYLVKPFDDERFAQALTRARRRIELEEAGEINRRLLEAVRTIGTQEGEVQPKPEYLERFSVELRGRVRVVPVADVDYITASGPYAELHAGDQTYLIRERMQTLEERLDPAVFFRIHRSAIVRVARVEELLRKPGGDYGVRLAGGTELSLSRARRAELEQRLGIE
jgi:two-component system, LytTR family, response regulator